MGSLRTPDVLRFVADALKLRVAVEEPAAAVAESVFAECCSRPELREANGEIRHCFETLLVHLTREAVPFAEFWAEYGAPHFPAAMRLPFQQFARESEKVHWIADGRVRAPSPLGVYDAEGIVRVLHMHDGACLRADAIICEYGGAAGHLTELVRAGKACFVTPDHVSKPPDVPCVRDRELARGWTLHRSRTKFSQNRAEPQHDGPRNQKRRRRRRGAHRPGADGV